jgi:hypothetical protein
MLKSIDDIRKSARERAARRWHNHAVERAFKEAQKQKEETQAKQTIPISPADVLEQEQLIKEATTKFESKFIKDIRAMLEDHVTRNEVRYAIAIRAQRKRLLTEKLRRLEAREAQRVAQQRRDLFS